MERGIERALFHHEPRVGRGADEIEDREPVPLAARGERLEDQLLEGALDVRELGRGLGAGAGMSSPARIVAAMSFA